MAEPGARHASSTAPRGDRRPGTAAARKPLPRIVAAPYPELSTVSASSIPPSAGPEPEANADPAVGTRFSAREISDKVSQSATEEMERSVRSLAWSSVAAGLTIGWSFVPGAFLSTLVPPRFQAAVVAAAYPTGFIFVVLARSQLFTENTLEPVMPLLRRRDSETFWKVLRIWGILLVGNIVGAAVFAVVFARTPVVSPELQDAMTAVAQHSVQGAFALNFYRAIFGGWLVALMAWLLHSTKMTIAQIALIWLTTAPISAFGFRHSIAGAVEAFYLAAGGHSSWGAAFGDFVVPVVLGNIVGGVVLVALLNYGQVADEVEEKS